MASITSSRNALKDQKYTQLAQLAAESGQSYAKACLDKNNNIPTWSNTKPLKPNTDCLGNETTTCVDSSTNQACFITIDTTNNLRSSFTVNLPTIDSSNKVTAIPSTGTVKLIRSSSGLAWKTYSQSIGVTNKSTIPSVTVAGGLLSSDSNYYYRTFKSSATFNITGGTLPLDVLIVAGGGGGGVGNSVGYEAGGGGGGGVIYRSLSVVAGTYNINVGSGGASASKGGDSSAFSLTATGGGYGASGGVSAGSGGSGGGSAHPNTTAGSGVSGQGYSGEQAGSNSNGGGGGGAAQAGGVRGYGSGGNGLLSDISGLSTYYGGGGAACAAARGVLGTPGAGGGGASSCTLNSGQGGNGTPNTGGGGGASYSSTSLSGGTGGSGIVIIRYLKSSAVNMTPPALITNGLIFNLDAGNTLSYSGSGSTWYDLSSNGNNGTLINGPSYSSSEGGVLSFNGTNQYVNMGSLNLQRDFTLSIWVYINGDTSGLFGQGGFAYNSGLHIMWYTTSSRGIIYGMYNNDLDSPGYPSPVGGWRNMVFTYSHSSYQKQFYSNSLLINSGSGQAYSGSGQFNIAGTYGSAVNVLYGKIGTVQMYSRVLSTSEISQNFNAFRDRYGL